LLVPWVPELFSAPALAALEERRRENVVDIPYFDGFVMGEVDALVESFAGEPRIQHPRRGLIEGEKDFREFAADTERWLQELGASVEDVQRIVLEKRGFEEVVVHLDPGDRRTDLPHGLVADHAPDGRIEEIRIYFSTRPLTGSRAERPPLLPADPDLREPGAVAAYQRALAGGDPDAVVAAFEADGRARESEAAHLVHGGAADLRAFYAEQLAGGGIKLEPCVLVEAGDTCALEYNSLRPSSPSPRAGLTVFVRGATDKLAAARIYDEL
jgi:hypothetical protein